MPPLIDALGLKEALRGTRPVRLLDVRWRLDEPEGRVGYVSGHLPGAVYVDLERELARRGYPELGTHPLPELRDLQESARSWGLRTGDLVVAYDDNDSVAASRAWWLLRRRGVDIRVLDGGLRAWVRAGGLLERGDVAPEAGDVVLVDADPDTIDIAEVADLPQRGILIDARAPQHYRGTVTGAEPVAGHIPGAINVPAPSHIDGTGRFRSPADIRGTLHRAGITGDLPVAIYCSTGIASAHSALAFSLAGVEARVFPGSWGQWARTRGRPVAQGRTPDQAVVGS